MDRISAVLLAAGESTRLGQVKALLPWQGKTMIQHQIDAITQAGATQIIVVIGYQAERLSPIIETNSLVKVVYNYNYRDGKVSSIKTGLKAVDPNSDTVFFLGVDQPRSAMTLTVLLKHHKDTGALITLPVYGRRGGHPPIFSASLIPELMTITEESAGLRAMVHQPGRKIERVEMPSVEILLDINTSHDYEKALEHLSSEKHVT